jgi:hypothetical protein
MRAFDGITAGGARKRKDREGTLKSAREACLNKVVTHPFPRNGGKLGAGDPSGWCPGRASNLPRTGANRMLRKWQW